MICIREMPSKPDISWFTQLFDYTNVILEDICFICWKLQIKINKVVHNISKSDQYLFLKDFFKWAIFQSQDVDIWKFYLDIIL